MVRAVAFAAMVLVWGCGSPPSADGPPSVLVIVVDTLRADYLETYGFERSTMPATERHLVDRGVVFERAFAPAPWTLPSMIGLFSGRRPGRDLADPHPATFRFPADRPTPAETFAAAGWATGAFVGNPLLGPATGFDRGFSEFFVVDSGPEAMEHPSRDLTDRTLAWLADTPGRFFAWVHYIDPHDPYLPPEAVRGVVATDPTYRGALNGRDVHALFAGRLTSADPERDARYLASLYEGELRAVDREIGRLLDGLGRRLASTLVVFTADHGEELYEHRGWKHGRTVFEEQLHVPLIVRWDGEVPPGSRVVEAVSLLDLVPTLADAAGLPAPPELDGSSLLPRLRRDVAGERPLTAAHHHTGPLRPSARLGRHKLVLFDRDAPSVPESPLDAHLQQDERNRLPRLALYDLAEDPQELSDRSRERPELVDQLALVAFEGLDRPGRMLVVVGLEPGRQLDLVLELGGVRPAWERLFLGAEDQVTLEQGRLRAVLMGDGAPKALVLPPEALPLRADPEGLARQGVVVLDGEGRPPLLPRERPGPVVATWIAASARAHLPRERDPELERTLRSLGYAQ
jgi:arylsulfatase A-like enzyme